MAAVNILPVLPVGYVVPQSNDEDNYNSWKEKNYYLHNVLVYLPLSTIKYENWNPEKLQSLLDPENGIRQKGCEPIRVSHFENGKVNLLDGMHRCCALQELRYTVVPAIIGVSCHECPVSDVMKEFLDKKELAGKLLNNLKKLSKQFRYAGIDTDNGPSNEPFLLNLNRKLSDFKISIPQEHLNSPGPVNLTVINGDGSESGIYLESLTAENLMREIQGFLDEVPIH